MTTKETVLQVIAEVGDVRVDELRPETELVGHLGIDSSQGLQILIELEDRLGIEIPDDVVADLDTVGRILEMLEEFERNPAA